ncbi:MAG TPA: MFS transporter [Alphaproteobacteria bacterium]|nr:MFS transporter [Alphaproteobacteria bacterium]
MATTADARPGTLADEFRQKWPLALVAYLMMLFAFGVPTFALPFIYPGAVAELHWTRSTAVEIAQFKFYTSAIAALVIGRLLDTVNPKYVVAICASLGALALIGFLGASNLFVYYGLGIVLGINAAGMAVAMNVIVARIFEHSTGTALGIVLSGTSSAGIIVPPIMAELLPAVGWQESMALLSLGIIVIALPAWFLLTRNGGSFAGHIRDGAHGAARSGMWDHFKDLARTRAFWFIFIGIFLIASVDQGFIQNQVLFLQNERGINLDSVAWAAALFATIGIVAKVGFGWLYDRLSIVGIVICYALIAISSAFSLAVTGVATMILFMVVRGVAHGGSIVDGPVLAKHYYGPQNLGLNIGIFTLCTSIGFGTGPVVMARMADASGSYIGSFILATAAAALATILLLPIKPRFWTKPA